MYHELGHDLLNYSHNRRVLSLMHPIIVSFRYDNNLDTILEEIENTWNTRNENNTDTRCSYPFN